MDIPERHIDIFESLFFLNVAHITKCTKDMYVTKNHETNLSVTITQPLRVRN